jgi:hypothetical protein
MLILFVKPSIISKRKYSYSLLLLRSLLVLSVEVQHLIAGLSMLAPIIDDDMTLLIPRVLA